MDVGCVFTHVGRQALKSSLQRSLKTESRADENSAASVVGMAEQNMELDHCTVRISLPRHAQSLKSNERSCNHASLVGTTC